MVQEYIRECEEAVTRVSTNLSEAKIWVSPKEDGTALTALWKFQTVKLSYIFSNLNIKGLLRLWWAIPENTVEVSVSECMQ